jgi:flagellar biosynthesis/type III secretory pathway ATPase
LDNLAVAILVVLIFALSVFFGFKFFTLRKKASRSIEDLAIDRLNARAHHVVIEFLRVYEMKNDMRKVAELERCNKMLSDYGSSFKAEMEELLKQEMSDEQRKVVRIAKFN